MSTLKKILATVCAGAITLGTIGILAENMADTAPKSGSGVYFKEIDGVSYVMGIAPGTTADGLSALLDGECVIEETEGLVKTGTRVITYENGTQKNISTVIIHGDVDCDGKVTAKDVIKLKKYIAGQPFTLNTVAADVDCDGDVDVNDKNLASKKVNATVKKLTVANNPEKAVYTDGEGFTSDGLILNAEYTNGDVFGIADGYEISYPATDGLLSEKYQYVTAKFGGKTLNVGLTVNEYSTENITDTVYYTMPAIPARAGVQVDLSLLGVQFTLGNTQRGGISWSSDELQISDNKVTASQKGVYTLTATYGGQSKSIYLVAQNRGDNEYVLYENTFDSGKGDIRVTENASLVSASGGKMTIGAKNSSSTVLLPEYVSNFGDYKINVSVRASAYAAQTSTFGIKYRGNYAMTMTIDGGVTLTQNGNVIDTKSYATAFNKAEYYNLSLDVHGVCCEGEINSARLVSSFENNASYTGDVGIYSKGVNALIEDIKVTLDFQKAEKHGTVTYAMPAIPAVVGASVWLNGYDVQFENGKTVNADDIVWSSSAVTVSPCGVVTPTAKGVYELKAKSGTSEKTVYLTVKNASDTEYVLYSNQFDSSSDITFVSGSSSVSGGKLVMNGKGSQSTVTFPDYIGNFGNYSIKTKFSVSGYDNDGSWLSIMFRTQNASNDYYQFNVRKNAANSSYNGVELTSNNNGSWQYCQMNSYTEALTTSSSYTMTAEVKDNEVIGYINGNRAIYCDTLTQRIIGKAGLQTYGINASFDYVEITLDYADTAAYCEEKYFDYSSVKPDNSYTTEYYGEQVLSYSNTTSDDFYSACRYFAENGARLYNKHNMNNGNLSATYIDGGSYYHVYYLKTENELNVVSSPNGAHILPKNIPDVTNGDYMPTVTQVYSMRVNGMTYIVQLADGSFIIYDGGWEDHTEHLWAALTRLNGGEDNIRVRAWVLTHAHEDHTYGFIDFSSKYGSKITLERIMLSPLSASDTDALGFPFYVEDLVNTVSKRFKGVVITPVHLGMLFNFSGVTMEILMTAEELYKDEYLSNFNNTSMVSRIFNGDYSCLFLGDAAKESAHKIITYYNYYTTSNMCQVAHHGVEDYPMAGYKRIRANILWYPCNTYLYELPDRDANVRAELREYAHTKEIILHDSGTITRKFGA